MEQEIPLPAPTHDSREAQKNRRKNPNYSWCGRCGQPWSVVDGHDTQYTLCRGVFPLCEGCWEHLTPVERSPYYARLVMAHPEDTYDLEETFALMLSVSRGN